MCNATTMLFPSHVITMTMDGIVYRWGAARCSVALQKPAIDYIMYHGPMRLESEQGEQAENLCTLWGGKDPLWD